MQQTPEQILFSSPCTFTDFMEYLVRILAEVGAEISIEQSDDALVSIDVGV